MIRLLRTAMLAGLLQTAAVAAQADEDCSALPTQQAMNQCASANYKAADAALGKAYKAVVARLGDDADRLALLRSAERAWINFRDAECSFAADGVAGGSIAPMIRAQCLQAQTEARTAALQAYLACEEGDLDCPVPPAP